MGKLITIILLTFLPLTSLYAVNVVHSLDGSDTVTVSGAYGLTLTLTAETSVTFPTSGTLNTTTGSTTSMTGYPTGAQPLSSNLTIWSGITPSSDAQTLMVLTLAEMATSLGVSASLDDLDNIPSDTVDDDKIDAACVATLNQATTGSAGSLKSTATTGLMSITGPGAGTTRVKTVRDANDTILELGGSYTPTGTWDWSSATLTFGTLAPTALNLKSSNADPGATAGQIKHDSTVAGLTTGSLVWYDGDEFRYPVDLDTLGTASEDGYFVKYDYSNGKYVLDEATAVNALDDLTDVVITSAQRGDILYRGASGWVNLHNDIAGEFLRTNGDGADPSWETPAGGGDMSAASYPHAVAFEALAVTDGNIAVGNGSTWVAESGATARTSLGAAASGANSDITSLTGLTTALATTMGGTGVKNNAASTITITGAYGLTLTLTDTTALTAPTSGTLATTAQIPTASSLHLDDLLTAVGLASEATTLGTFTGSTIDDGSTVTEALQALETAAESASTPSLDIVGDMAADGSIGMTGYKLTLTSTLNAAGANMTLTNTTADLTADVSFFDLKYTDNGDANGYYLRGYDNSGADLQWSIGQNGNISTAGTIQSTAATSSITMSAAEATITHSGATSLTMASTTGGVAINAGGTVTINAGGEDIVLTGGTNTVALSSTTSNALIDTGTIGLNLEDASLEVPNSDDPDVAVAGRISWDTDGWLRAYDGAAQVAVGRKLEEIHVTVITPQDLADAERDAFIIWSNESGMSFIVTGWKGWAGTDDTTLAIEETDADGTANAATVDAVELATGSGPYTGSDTSITAATVENGHVLRLDFDDTDDPTYVKMTIYGYYNADVN